MVAVHLLKYLIFTHTIIIPSLLATPVAGGIHCQAEQMNYVWLDTDDWIYYLNENEKQHNGKWRMADGY